jgi:hypothetical protein
MKKKCRDCGKLKKLTQFYPHISCSHGVRSECKTCEKKRRAIRHQRAKKNNPDQRRSVVLKNKYGITITDFNKMLVSQKFKCGVCKSTYPGPKGVFAVDHCHKTNKVRGLLCYLCNVGLGSFRDNIDYLTSAISYLKRSS